MKGRIFLASGFVAIALIIGAVLLAAGSGGKQPAALDAPEAVRQAAAPRPVPQAPPRAARAEEPFVIKRILPIDGPIRYGEWHWNDKDVPEGPIVVTVDLDARVLSVFRNGYEIGATAVLLGTEDTPTPLGVFPITEKDADHVSNIYTGAPMPYMQRLTEDGITLHGSEVELGYASHGCIGMPEPFAAKLFHTTKLGDKVYITRGKRIGVGDSLVG
ncbi:MAG TPA: L,D-transpeptidase family protein [Novosphingobium sp.]|nr:L,D-transpeptidase family protein [Novosphingobium sp.]